jgi:putative SOS response-associated peptidase YedK
LRGSARRLSVAGVQDCASRRWRILRRSVRDSQDAPRFAPPRGRVYLAVNDEAVTRVCNRYGYLNPLARLAEEFSRLGPIRWSGLEPNAPRDQIRPTDPAPIIREGRDRALEVVELRWGLVPWFHKAPLKAFRGLNTNARAETVGATASFKGPYGRRRALVPATQYYEWTENPDAPKGRKLMWKFTVTDQPVFAMAGLWEHAQTADGPVESFALLTCPAGPDVTPYHDRQPAILRPDQWAAWMDPANDMAPRFTGSPAGTIAVERFEPT